MSAASPLIEQATQPRLTNVLVMARLEKLALASSQGIERVIGPRTARKLWHEVL